MLRQVKINDRVAIRIKAGGDFASIKDDAGTLYTAVINELRNDKVVLTTTDQTDGFLSSCKVGTKTLLQKPGSSGVTICRAFITAVLSHVPPIIVLRPLTPAEKIQRRASVRVPMGDAEIRYSQPDSQIWRAAILRDLSKSGACLITHNKPALGETLVVELYFDGQMIYLNGVVRRCRAEKTNYAVGLEFVDNREIYLRRMQRAIFKQQLAIYK